MQSSIADGLETKRWDKSTEKPMRGIRGREEGLEAIAEEFGWTLTESSLLDGAGLYL
jgi:hypothetical protein